MEERMIRMLVTALFFLVFTVQAQAGEYATPDEAKLLALKAADYVKANGREKAFAAFGEKEGAFRDRDLYVFVFDRKGNCLFHAINPALVGRDLISMKDVDGKMLTQDIISVKGPDWVDYKWKNPQTNLVQLKTTYVVPVPTAEGEIVVSVGAYKH
jgi:cytochrome c